ncbi:transcriptional regulator [Ornithinimicrobium sp. F0845]|uniref:transcriptional regulator n=1 Tax=Ornithinimicrobium sp. F0845 TaxID=2926412 RepID=UPI001FF66056|nr:transcriptional regulator [Ornithinimicrobium sp. F0845]MCK0111436.1 transcriptional regulator [Ornithinimicrobium sp. F0845]
MTDSALLALHGVRVLGHATSRAVAALYGLDHAPVEEHLLDAEARGQVRREAYLPGSNWSMTELGRHHEEELLAAELDVLGVREEISALHRSFLPLNRRLGPLMTRWQLRPTPDDALAFNDHTDLRYDDRILRELARLVDQLGEVTHGLESALPRFGVHQPRLTTALERALNGERQWVDAPEVASINIVWIQLHEDMLATLGIRRGDEPAGT